MKRKFMSIIIVVLLLLSLTSCGETKPITISGEVLFAPNGTYFLVNSENGSYTGVVILSDTEIDYGEYVDFGSYIVEGYSVDVVCTTEIEGENFENTAYYEDVDKWYVADKIVVTDVCLPVIDTSTQGFGKPVIYLYPEEETEVTVDLDFGGELVCTYPKSDGVWNVTAQPDGTLTDEKGTEYNYLFWEGEAKFEFDFSKGFCVKGDDTAEFLETALVKLGLTRREANEFIVYWLPFMEANEYNVISFQGDNYAEHAKLTVEPTPDTMLRVYMAWYGAEEQIDIEPQELTAPERDGFTVVEWGGSEVIK